MEAEMKQANRFQKGTGRYTCGVCKRQTRATGRGDNEHVGLCVECYEIAGIENEIADNGDPSGKLAAEIEQYKVACRAKGGVL
jgi:hypothetical protein